MINLIEKYPYISLLLCVFIMLGFTIDAIPLSIMEARNYISAREMLTDSNWFLTTMNGEVRYEKPPLPTWITAIFGYFFGITNVHALRLAPLLMIPVIGIYIIKLSYLLTENKLFSRTNGFVVITSFYVIAVIIEGVWDIYAHGFMLIALYHMFIMLTNKTISVKNGLLFSLFIGLSILSKGPVSLYVLFLPFIISYGIAYGYSGKKLDYLKLVLLVLLGLLIGGSWYLYIRFSDPELFNAMTSKETSNWSNWEVRPFYYYWSFFTQSGLWTIPAFISLLYPYLKNRVLDKKAYKFTLYWIIIAVILLSIIPEKKSRYLMPVLLPLAINIGFYLEYVFREFKNLKNKRETIPVYFYFGLVGCIAILTPVLGFFIDDYLSEFPIVNIVLLSIASLAIGALIIKSLIKKNIYKTFYYCIGFTIILGLIGLPIISNLKKSENYNSTLSLKSKRLYRLNYIAPEMIYLYGDKIPLFNFESAKTSTEDKFYVTCHECEVSDFNTFSSHFNIEVLDNLDLNTVPKSSKSHNERIDNMLVYFTRK